ncbi:MAG: AtpZ/AtpI family protein [Elusimicrobia bacterium]|nr:AtpZ/AtpI family protein [Elusimicrobiota bacterium]
MKEREDNWTSYVQLGLELSLYVIIFSFLGFWLDYKLNTKPFLTLSGAFLGIISVFYVLWKRFLRNKND